MAARHQVDSAGPAQMELWRNASTHWQERVFYLISVGTFDGGSHILPISAPDTASDSKWSGVLTITTETDLNFTVALAQPGGREVKHRDRTG